MSPVSRRTIQAALSFAIATGVWFSSAALAAKAGENVRELAVEYQESKKAIVDTEAQKRRILGSLYTINKRMKKISREKGQLTDELFHVQGNVQSIAKVIAALETQISAQGQRLRTRLRVLYKLSGEGMVAMMFSQTSAHEMDQTLKYLKIVTDADWRLMRAYQQNVAVYKEQRRRLRGQVEKLVSLERAIKRQEGLLVHEHKEKTKIVSSLEASRTAAIKKIRTIRSATSRMKEKEELDDEEVSGLLKASFFEEKGRLPQPIVGVVVSDFGLVRDPDYKVHLSHKGWQYRAPAGTPVSAVFDGTVVHSGWLMGYGQTLVIDHGDHYYTVYGHLAQPRLKVGDEVRKGQPIALAGSTSREHGDGIYFEIRHFSEPENPRVWIETRGIPVSSKDGSSSDPVGVAGSARLGTE